MTVETIKGSIEPLIPEDNYNTYIAEMQDYTEEIERYNQANENLKKIKATNYYYCPNCNSRTYNASKNCIGDPDTWEDYTECPVCLWCESDAIEEIEF